MTSHLRWTWPHARRPPRPALADEGHSVALGW